MNETQSSPTPIFPPTIPRSPLLAGIAALVLFAGAASASAATYSAPAPISIPGFSQASPYPAAIDVTGLTGTVTDVNVRFHNLTHGEIDDVAVVLQGPNGQSIMVMDGAGGLAVSDVTLTIDDEAAQQFSSTTNPSTGSYRPAQYYTSDSFPAPGPGAGYCTPGRSRAATARWRPRSTARIRSAPGSCSSSTPSASRRGRWRVAGRST